MSNEFLYFSYLFILFLFVVYLSFKNYRLLKKGNKKFESKQNLFERILNTILKLNYLKRFSLAIGIVKGFSVDVEFFEQKIKGEKE